MLPANDASAIRPLPVASAPTMVVMGVCGCGKSAVGEMLAQALGCRFVEGDGLHPSANVARMAAGLPLDDDDRREWLAAIALTIDQAARAGERLVVSCSALKRRYRDRLREAAAPIAFIHLAGDRALITERMRGRSGHFMPLSLIDSQFAALEPPQADEVALTFDIRLPPPEIVRQAIDGLAALAGQQPETARSSAPGPQGEERADA